MGHLARIFAAAICVACVCAGAIVCQADDSLRVALGARYADMKAALAAHDSAAIAAIFAPDFASVDVSGQSKGTAQVIADVTAMKPDPNRSSETTLLSVTPSADAVIVEQRYHMKAVVTAADGMQHSVELVTLSTDKWVKPAEIWLMQRTVTNELSVFRDGRLVVYKKKP
jgi:ketosteroid isomerase-like protein